MTAELSAIAALTSIFVITWCRRSATGASVLEPSRPSLAIQRLVVLGLQLTLRSPFQFPDAARTEAATARREVANPSGCPDKSISLSTYRDTASLATGNVGLLIPC